MVVNHPGCPRAHLEQVAAPPQHEGGVVAKQISNNNPVTSSPLTRRKAPRRGLLWEAKPVVPGKITNRGRGAPRAPSTPCAQTAMPRGILQPTAPTQATARRVTWTGTALNAAPPPWLLALAMGVVELDILPMSVPSRVNKRMHPGGVCWTRTLSSIRRTSSGLTKCMFAQKDASVVLFHTFIL